MVTCSQRHLAETNLFDSQINGYGNFKQETLFVLNSLTGGLNWLQTPKKTKHASALCVIIIALW